MAKQKHRQRNDPRAARTPAPQQPPARLERISRAGWRVITIGAGTVIAGFYLLSLTDPAGRNWASTLSPFVLLGGYAVIGLGIALPEKTPAPVQTRP